MNKEYECFLRKKKKTLIESGFDIDESLLSSHLFDFQKFSVKWALKKGRSALFEDCGLGKTQQQIEWALQVNRHTNEPVLILAPLAVVGQTKKESIDYFGYELYDATSVKNHCGVEITNYEQLDNIDCSAFSGVVLDESSILKGKDSKTKNKLLEYFKNTRYKLCCTAKSYHMEESSHGNAKDKGIRTITQNNKKRQLNVSCWDS